MRAATKITRRIGINNRNHRTRDRNTRHAGVPCLGPFLAVEANLLCLLLIERHTFILEHQR